jgi:hypothetical protein
MLRPCDRALALRQHLPLATGNPLPLAGVVRRIDCFLMSLPERSILQTVNSTQGFWLSLWSGP